MTTEILLRISPTAKPVPITPKAHSTGKHGYLVLGSVEIGSQAGMLAATLRRLADDLDAVVIKHPFDRVTTITPAEVIAHFEQSPILREMAGDVRAVLGDLPTVQIDPIQSDLQAVAHLVNPSLADISEELTGSRQYGGATYKRVKAVKDALKSSTTPPKNGVYRPNSANKAA